MGEFETISEISAGYVSGEVSPSEIVARCLGRIERFDHSLNAFLCVARDHALAAAATADAEIRAGRRLSTLHGIPFALKDIIDREGFATTAHSRLLADNVAARSAACVRKLEAAGAIFLGKLATHEFAIGGPAFDLPVPPARNPWNRDHFTGGSSSGSGVAVAARMVPLALGTDTNGSVRNPAAACGIVGMKPTRGLISLDGVIELSRSLDVVGPMTSDVTGNALALDVLAGISTTLPAKSSVPSLAGLRIGVIRRFYRHDMIAAPEMDAGIESALGVLGGLGAEISEVDAPPLSEFADCNRVILVAEAYSVHRKSLRSRYADYSKSLRERVLPGAFIQAADYEAARRLQRHFTSGMNRILDGFDVLVTATNLDPPARFDQDDVLTAQYTRHARAPFSLTGHPALSVPVGVSADGLPLAMQIIGKHHDERSVYRVALAHEMANPPAFAAPPLVRGERG